MNLSRLAGLVSVSLLVFSSSPARGQQPDRPADPGADFKESDSEDGRWNETDLGPFIASVLPLPGGPIAKGLSIRVGDEQQGTVAYDTATMTCRAAWTGGFVKFDPRRFGITSAPAPAGPIQWQATKPAWGDAKVAYEGMYQHGKRVVLAYRVNGVRVLEVPWALGTDPVVFTRTLVVEPHDDAVEWSFEALGEGKDRSRVVVTHDGTPMVSTSSSTATVRLPAAETPQRFVLLIGESPAIDEHAVAARELDPAEWLEPGPRLWTATIESKGSLGTGDGPYVVDTIAVPFENPWKALMFCAGLDFLSDGTAVVSTLHGDVWLVQGIDDSLETVTWQRFATGLHQPLGVHVRREDGDADDAGEIYVLGRDQITRLHDRNRDGEADFYECFNNDGATSTSGHDFAACLEADPAGNLYYIRAHEGVVRVSADGSEHEAIAAGFRNPIGLGVGPQGMVTAAPQEGNWTPKSAIFEVRPGGWYGFAGPKESPTRPIGYDPPICWIPRLSDNSSGGQVWVAGDKWGPLEGRMLHLSYGQCALLLVTYEHVNGIPQGGTLRLEPFFESGVMTGRFHPGDGQLYVAGLRGWQTAAAKDGCLQRVRYTGRPVHLPVELHVKPRGVELTFSNPLDPESAADPQNWAVEQWNYRYTKEYGSEDYRVSDPRRTGHDEVFLLDVTLADDGRTVFLEFEEPVEPVMQMAITYLIRAADGTELRDTVHNTVNAVPEE